MNGHLPRLRRLSGVPFAFLDKNEDHVARPSLLAFAVSAAAEDEARRIEHRQEAESIIVESVWNVAPAAPHGAPGGVRKSRVVAICD